MSDTSKFNTGPGHPHIDEDLVRKTARLARLEILEDEIPNLVEHMEKILDLVSDLGIEDSSEESSAKGSSDELSRTLQDWRADEPAGEDQPGGPRDPDQIGSNAPDWRDGTFVTPRVVGGE
ncbi:hypothetical protein CBD41_02825 [bacterium TMED181]|nr:hypothetical protein [Planctomycetota bacterium]OUW46216.1 MAG: hypothetical protein CBD41_02825 [bacterium TMED181]